MSERKIKITDRRMFTPDGQLREEYRYLEDEAQGGGVAAETGEGEVPVSARGAEPSARDDTGPAGVEEAPLGEPPEAAEPGRGSPGDEDPDGPSFFDLLGLIANPVGHYLEQARYGGPEARESLELARLHVDLLGVLQRKTAGNLSAREKATLDDVLYQLRMTFIDR